MVRMYPTTSPSRQSRPRFNRNHRKRNNSSSWCCGNCRLSVVFIATVLAMICYGMFNTVGYTTTTTTTTSTLSTGALLQSTDGTSTRLQQQQQKYNTNLASHKPPPSQNTHTNHNSNIRGGTTTNRFYQRPPVGGGSGSATTGGTAQQQQLLAIPNGAVETPPPVTTDPPNNNNDDMGPVDPTDDLQEPKTVVETTTTPVDTNNALVDPVDTPTDITTVETTPDDTNEAPVDPVDKDTTAETTNVDTDEAPVDPEKPVESTKVDIHEIPADPDQPANATIQTTPGDTKDEAPIDPDKAAVTAAEATPVDTKEKAPVDSYNLTNTTVETTAGDTNETTVDPEHKTADAEITPGNVNETAVDPEQKAGDDSTVEAAPADTKDEAPVDLEKTTNATVETTPADTKDEAPVDPNRTIETTAETAPADTKDEAPVDPNKTTETTAETAPADTKDEAPTNPNHKTDATQSTNTKENDTNEGHRVAGLSCEAFGGPANADDMVYWKDLPSDADYESPLRKPSSSDGDDDDDDKEEQFLTFEPDEGGWNNIRMAMETAVGLAVAMGRTLVLPPKTKFYLLWDDVPKKNVMTFADFFHFDSVVKEHPALKVIAFEDFLQKHAMDGQLRFRANNTVSFPPGNVTDWTGKFYNFESTKGGEGKPLWEWMRAVTTPLEWTFDKCVIGLPNRRDGVDIDEKNSTASDRMQAYLQTVLDRDSKSTANSTTPNQAWNRRVDSFTGHPTPVDAPPADRLAELLASRAQVCVYNETLQNARIVHALGESASGYRLLIHFYAYFFFEDWKQDLWMKRFIRDHFRYIDEIQCAAARIIQEVRKKAVAAGSPDGQYDSFHVRRGDFQYKLMHLSAEEIYENSRTMLNDTRTVFIATDEKNRTFFDPLRQHYNLVFLDDFVDVIPNVSKNYYGMLDQLVASRGEVFVGVMYSTFTGYINRIRGYQAQKKKLEGYKEGVIESFNYVPESQVAFRHIMKTYHSVIMPFWSHEFPVCWRDIDHDVDENTTVER